MRGKRYKLKARLVAFDDYAASWTYIFIPFNKVPDVDPRGWGSIPVEVLLGSSTWRTSMFPLKKEGYFLPIKKLILKKENLHLGDTVSAEFFAF